MHSFQEAHLYGAGLYSNPHSIQDANLSRLVKRVIYLDNRNAGNRFQTWMIRLKLQENDHPAVGTAV